MAASFPSSVWAGYAVVDLVDFWNAAIANPISEEIVALENYLITTTRADNTALLGPATGGPLAPTWRTFVGADIPQATTTTRGTVEFATDAEVDIGTDAGRSVTVANLRWDLPLVPAALKGVRLDVNADILLPNAASIGIGGAAERIEFYSAGYVAVMGANFGVGTVTPAALVDLAMTASGGLQETAYSANNNVKANIVIRKSASGSLGTVAETADTEDLGAVNFQGVNSSSAFATAVQILAEQAGASGATYVGGRLSFLTGTNAAAATARMTIDSAGNVGIGTSVPGSLLELNLGTEDLEIVDAGSAAATEQDWVEVQVGGVTGYIRIFAAK